MCVRVSRDIGASSILLYNSSLPWLCGDENCNLPRVWSLFSVTQLYYQVMMGMTADCLDVSWLLLDLLNTCNSLLVV